MINGEKKCFFFNGWTCVRCPCVIYNSRERFMMTQIFTWLTKSVINQAWRQLTFLLETWALSYWIFLAKYRRKKSDAAAAGRGQILFIHHMVFLSADSKECAVFTCPKFKHQKVAVVVKMPFVKCSSWCGLLIFFALCPRSCRPDTKDIF